MVKQIVRIEHPDTGYGIFQSSHIFDENVNKEKSYLMERVMERHNKSFPSITIDFRYDKLFDNYDELFEYFCGFLSIEQFNQWFEKEEVQYFAECGFKVYLIKVSHSHSSEYQTIFKKEHIITQEEITSLFI